MQASIDLLNKHRTGLLRQLEAFNASSQRCREAIRSITAARKCIEKEIATLEHKIQQLIEQHHGELYQRLQSIPGVGQKAALLLIVLSGGFTKFENSKQLSSYIGLTPRIFESGTSIKVKARITKMGMSRIRAILYVCAWSAKRCNEACISLYESLVAKGKAKRQALIAVANKLLKQASAIAINDTVYQKNYVKRQYPEKCVNGIPGRVSDFNPFLKNSQKLV